MMIGLFTRQTLFCVGFTVLIYPSLSTTGLAQRNLMMPGWLQNHMIYMTKGTGRWITDNSNYKGPREQSDEYGTEWKWGVRKQSIKGRLFGLRNKKETRTFWEYRLFWHPKERRAVLQQYGGNGAFGIGEMRFVKTTKGAEIVTEMTFHSPNGRSWKDLHRVTEFKNENQTKSYDWRNGKWVLRRTYVWKRAIIETP